jgi:hypothetical protein
MRVAVDAVGFLRRLGQALGVAHSVLQEIFDESGYARFLERNKVESSCAAYAGFLRENEVIRARRTRCC